MSTATISSAIETLGKAIAADPEKARAKATPATARLLEGLRCEVSGPKGEKAYTDMPPPMGGAGSAPNPGWYMRGAIASCAVTTIAMRAAKQGIELTQLEITVESDGDHRGLLGLDERISASFSALRLRIKIAADGVDPARVRALAEWGDAHSPVGCTVRKSPPIAVSVEVA